MIIHTGNRTHIPAFYSQWFLSSRFNSFLYKNPGPMLPHMELLKSFGQYWFVAITP